MSHAQRFLLAALACSGLTGAAAAAPPECLTALNRWQRIGDSDLSPAFIARESSLDVERVLVCEDRLHLFVRAREGKAVASFCLVFFAPAPEDVARFYDLYGENADEPVARIRDIARHGAEAREEFVAFKEQMRGVLGRRFVEGKTVSFARDRYRPRLEIGGGEFTFSWRKGNASFAGWFVDVYYAPEPGLSPVWVFMLLYPR